MVLARPATRAAILTPRGGQLLAADSFTDADATALTSHTAERGGAWAVSQGTITIQSNRAGVATNGTNHVGAVQTLASPNVRIDVTARLHVALQRVGVMVRYQDTSNNWFVGIDDNLNTVLIGERIAGTPNTRASGAFSPSLDTDYRLTVIARGSTILAYVDGVLIASYASAINFASAVKHGLYSSNATAGGALWDDYSVRGV